MKLILKIFVFIFAFSSCNVYKSERADENIAVEISGKSIIKQPYKSLTADNKLINNFIFWKIDSIPDRKFTYNELESIRDILPSDYKEYLFYIVNEEKDLPLFLFTRSKEKFKKNDPLNLDDIYIEIPVVKLNDKIFINIGVSGSKKELKSELEKNYNKIVVMKIMERFNKGLVEKPYSETGLYSKRIPHFME